MLKRHTSYGGGRCTGSCRSTGYTDMVAAGVSPSAAILVPPVGCSTA